MTPDAGATSSRTVPELLVSAGVLEGKGLVDIGFYSIRLGLDSDVVRRGLDSLAEAGHLARLEGWLCSQCSAENATLLFECEQCAEPRPERSTQTQRFVRPERGKVRDVAALFLIHGMTTVGAWQQDLSWRMQLVYGYSIPTFIFKFGWDAVSPIRHTSQKRRTSELASAIKRAQADLERRGFAERCDVIAHSFGTLLLARLLASREFEEIRLGRVVLTGSIVDRAYDWQKVLASGRIEALLNHRAGRDQWVPLSPWFFPNAGASGVHGFAASDGISDLVSPQFKHSDYFAANHFGAVRDEWARFLSAAGPESRQSPRPLGLLDSWTHRYWFGRFILAVIAGIALVATVALVLGACWLVRQVMR